MKTRFIGVWLLALYIVLFALHAQAATITLAWDPSDGAAGYKIYAGTASRNYSTIKDVGNVTSYTTPDLSAGYTYWFAATAYDATSLESDYSDEVSYTAITLVKNVGLGALIPTSMTHAAGLIKWDTVPGATGYKVKYGTVKGVYPTVIDSKLTQSLIPGLKNNTTYYVVVAAYGSDLKETGNSAELTFKTLAVTGLTAK